MGDHRRALLSAPPGAGKTTEVPRALLDESWANHTIVVTQPRRIAARLAASYVARQLGESVGQSVGYRVRFDERVSRETRLVFETEGLFLRRVLAGHALDQVSAVVIDEVHERSTAVDALIALLVKAQSDCPELRVLLMSATLDAPKLGTAFDQAPLVESFGRSFPIDIIHQDKLDDRPLPIQVRSAIAQSRDFGGDILVFLPGAREIRQVTEGLDRLDGFDVLALHGELPLADQARVTGSSTERRRIILSTNVAESSVTIPGVRTVIDTGLARIARHDPLSGALRLQTEEISQARLTQRAGRAGRTSEGRCFRLFSRGSAERRPAADTPEILRADLAEMHLLLSAAGHDPRRLEWPSPPTDQAWADAQGLLTELGALEGERVTDIGRKMAELPLSPRLARVVVEGHRLGATELAARAAALLSERDLKRRSFLGRHGAAKIVLSDSDIEDRLALLERAEGCRFNPSALRAEDIDPTAARAISQLHQRLVRLCSDWSPPDERAHPVGNVALLRALLAGFFDRVAERRGTGRDLVLSTGARAVLSEESAVSGARYLLAVAAGGSTGSGGKIPLIQLAVRLDPDQLLDLCPGRVSFLEDASYDRARDRVDVHSRICFGKVVLSQDVEKAGPGPLRKRILLEEALVRGEAAYDPDGRLESLGVRLGLLAGPGRELLPHLPEADRELLRLAADHETLCGRALDLALDYSENLAELRQADLAESLLGSTGGELRLLLDRYLPQNVALPSGQTLRVVYGRNQPPHAASRLQDFFSMSATPTLLDGKLPLQLHLLAPNRRAIQVTTDLRGFWERHYPDLRKALMRRYPKHSWPEDGLTATPPPPGRLR